MTTSTATVQRILDTAVTLFAEKGFEQTSVRDITAAAGVNIAAINYHFGSRDALIQAVAERYLTPLCLDMERQLDDHDAGNAELSLEDLLALLISAMLNAVERDVMGVSLFMRLLCQAYMSSDDALRGFLERRYGRSFRRFLAQVSGKVPRLSASEFYWRCHFLVGSSVLPLARYGLLSGQEQRLLGQHATEAEVFHRLVAFLAAGLRAEADLVSASKASPLQQAVARPSPTAPPGSSSQTERSSVTGTLNSDPSTALAFASSMAPKPEAPDEH